MAFKRMEGFAGSIPQGFIDRNVSVCPLCGSNHPHWALDQKMQMKLEGNLYLFQCEQCKGVISSPVADVTGYNNTIITTTGLLKKMSGKENGVIYMRVEDIGSSGATDCIGREFTLQELNATAAQKQNKSEQAESYMTPPIIASEQSFAVQPTTQNGPKMIITEQCSNDNTTSSATLVEQPVAQGAPKMIVTQPNNSTATSASAKPTEQKTIMVKNQKVRILSIVAAVILTTYTIYQLVVDFSLFLSFPNIIYNIINIFIIVCLFRGKKDKFLIAYPIFKLVMSLVSLFTGGFGLPLIITVFGNIALLLLFAACLNINLPKSNNFNSEKIKKLWIIPVLLNLTVITYSSCTITFSFNFLNLLSYVFGAVMSAVVYNLIIPLWLASPTEIEQSATAPKSTNTDNLSADTNEGYTDLLKHILLLFFTFGVWYLIWIYKVTVLLNKKDETESRNPATQLLLCLFVPFYIIYWTYKSAQKIDAWACKRGVPSGITTLCLILSFVFPVLTPIIMQEKINSIVNTASVQTAYQQYTPQAAPIPTKPTEIDIETELNKYKELLAKGIITQEDFDAKKKQLLGL